MRRTALVLLLALQTGCSGTQLLNTFTPSSGYRTGAGLVYDPAHRLTLDLYTPIHAHREPVVVFFAGGRWRAAAPEDYRFVGQALASQGFLAVLPQVRPYPRVRFPAFVEDAARAVRWAHENAARYGGDPDKVFVMGHSSGAHLAALLALAPEHLAAAGLRRAKLRGMIGLAGPYDFMPITSPDLRDMFGPPERFELSQPVTHADGANPPLLLLHGADDDTVSADNTRRLAAAVARAGGPVESHVYPEMSHRWIVATLAAPLRGRSDVLARIADFVRRVAAEPASAIDATPLERP